jgi:hypothetical protein
MMDKINLNGRAAHFRHAAGMIFAAFHFIGFHMTDFGALQPRLGSMRHKTTQTVFTHFNRIRGGNSAPLRADIQPSELKSVLPDVFILEMDRRGSPVFRLAGTRVCAILGRELRGEDFMTLWHAPHGHKMKLAAEAVLANQAPIMVKVRSVADEESAGDLEMLLLPLSSRPGVVDRLYGSLADLSHPPLRTERSRILLAETLTFVASEPCRPQRLVAENVEAVTVVSAQGASLRSRIMHLKVLEGGRKD